MDTDADSGGAEADAMQVESANGHAAPEGTLEPDGLAQASTPTAAVYLMLPVLRRLGVHLHAAPLLLARTCRLCIAALDEAKAAAPRDPAGAKSPARATELSKLSAAIDACIDAAVLPALTVSGPNPGLGHELWALLEVLPGGYTSRYRAYGALFSHMKDESTPLLSLARAKTSDETKRMMRRLSKENTKQCAGAHCSHSLCAGRRGRHSHSARCTHYGRDLLITSPPSYYTTFS